MDPRQENLAETLARELPKGQVLHSSAPGGQDAGIVHLLVPKNAELKVIDYEKLLLHPRRKVATATFQDAASFLEYVKTHANGAGKSAAVWVDFNPTTAALSFEAVLDEHSELAAGWRGHKARFTPMQSVEWKTWTGKSGKEFGQAAFAEFLEENEKDIAGGSGFPSSLDMMAMATEFEANAEKRFKSKMRLQSGGVQLEYVNTDDEATIERMRVFERFQIGLPVFWQMRTDQESVPAWPIEARLKYRVQQGSVIFYYQLIRPDIVHEAAALALIDQVRAGLGDVPMRMGGCS